MSQYSFFVCGTPSNKRGFEWICSGTKKLPGVPGRYLDVFDRKTMGEGKTYVSRVVEAEGRKYAMLTLYEPINPYDDETNRGAFIASGIITGGGISLDEVLSSFMVLNHMCAELTKMRDSRNAFPPGFSLKNLNLDAVPQVFPAAKIVDAFLRNSAYLAGDAQRDARVVVNTEARVHAAGGDETTFLEWLSNSRNVERLKRKLLDCETRLRATEGERKGFSERMAVRGESLPAIDARLTQAIEQLEDVRDTIRRDETAETLKSSGYMSTSQGRPWSRGGDTGHPRKDSARVSSVRLGYRQSAASDLRGVEGRSIRGQLGRLAGCSRWLRWSTVVVFVLLMVLVVFLIANMFDRIYQGGSWWPTGEPIERDRGEQSIERRSTDGISLYGNNRAAEDFGSERRSRLDGDTAEIGD